MNNLMLLETFSSDTKMTMMNSFNWNYIGLSIKRKDRYQSSSLLQILVKDNNKEWTN